MKMLAPVATTFIFPSTAIQVVEYSCVSADHNRWTIDIGRCQENNYLYPWCVAVLRNYLSPSSWLRVHCPSFRNTD